ncbi:MAG: SDR family NAD(P)-dependent oxidoreductase [Deltaproteobacteria bacterium]|nr:SDR family NAD(P)-dependent oxidoreductase [Deltaproteobacteria bacterium]
MNLEEPNFGSLVELLRLRAREDGERRAKTFLGSGGAEATHLTFAELDSRAQAIAARLQQSFRPGARALLLFPPGLDFTEAFFGCLYAGIVAVPAPPPDPRRLARTLPRVSAILEDAAPAVVLTVSDLLPDLEASAASEARLRGIEWLATDGVSSHLAATWDQPLVRRDSLAYLQYTSGSTAAPKGVMSTHGHILDNAAYLREGFDYDPDSVALIWVPNYHDDGLIHGVVQSIFTGCQSLRMSPMDVVRRPADWLRAITEHQVTHSGGPNFIYELTRGRVREKEREGLDLSSWKVAYNAAEPIRPSTLRGFYQAFAPQGFRWSTFCPAFGMAETTLLVAAKARGQEPVILPVDSEMLERRHRVEPPQTGSPSRELVGCGQPVGEARFVIVDADTLEPLPEGAVGELWIQDKCVAEGYWQRLEATCETFEARLAGSSEGPFLRTGDLAFLRDGELFIAGRLKDLIILRGRNLYPQDLELSAEAAHSQFRRGCTAAFSVPFSQTPEGEERLVVVQEVQKGCSEEEGREAAGALRQAVAQDHDAEVWAVVLIAAGTLPKTSSGKIQRAACRAAFLADELVVVAEARQRYVASLQPRAEGAEEASTGPTSTSVAAPRSSEVVQPSPPGLNQGATTTGKKDTAPPGPFSVTPSGKPGQADIAQWMTQRLAARLVVEPHQVDPRQPFARYGLGSEAMVSLAAELEEWLGRELPQTLLYEHGSIEAASRHLTVGGEISGDRVGAEAARLVTGSGPNPGPGPGVSPRSEARSEAQTEPISEPIAIIGLGCRLPGASGPNQLWQLLQQAVDAVTEVPADRWAVDEVYQAGAPRAGKTNSRWGGFLDQVDRFDPYFFGISPREAERMDPQQRLLLEVAWETLEDGGVPAESLSGSDAGVYVGIGMSDYGRWLFEDSRSSDAYSGTGGALSIAANRISYCFDFRGPSLAVDTACSSSLVAILEACHGLWRGDCSVALAGGANVLLSPEVTVNFSQGGFLASDGRCKAFDSRADGYVRSEGVALVLLKPLSQAEADGDRIYAVVRGGAVNQDGRSNGLTAPNPEAQRQMLSQAYSRAGVDPRQVQYVEAHGTGTPLGDPIEAQAIGAVLGEGREEGERCAIGSIKTNLGHLETAAGVAGLMKVALSLYHQERVPNLHYREANPRIHFADLGLRVQRAGEPWPASGAPRLAGVSSFGFGGTNAHVVLAEAPRGAVEGDVSQGEESPSVNGLPELAPISAHNPAALAQRVEELIPWLQLHRPPLGELVDTLALRRGHLDHRLTVVASDLDELLAGLEASSRGEPHPGLARGQRPAVGPAPMAFVFSGQGSQWPAMGCQLMNQEPVFRRRLEEVAAALEAEVDWSPLEELARGVDSSRLLEIDIIQPLIFAVQVSLAALWQSWGIRPDWVVGHSLGEVAAACIAGGITLQEGARVICHRSRLMRRASGHGTMLAAEVGAAEAEALLAEVLEEMPGQASIAVYSSPSAVAFSGEAGPLGEIQGRLEAREIFCRPVKVDVAAHSPHMEPLLDELGATLADLKPNPLAIPMVSTVTGEKISGEVLDALYWQRNLRQPVRFAAAVETLLGQGVETFLEISSHPLVVGAIGQIAAQRGSGASRTSVQALPSLRREEEERRSLLTSLGELYAQGRNPHWNALDSSDSARLANSAQVANSAQLHPREVRRKGRPSGALELPLYPWQRERYWFRRLENVGTGHRSRASSGVEGAVLEHSLLGSRLELAGRKEPLGGEPGAALENLWQGTVGEVARGLLGDHQVRGRAVFPGAAWFEMALAAARSILPLETAVELREVSLEEALVVSSEDLEDGSPGVELQTRCWLEGGDEAARSGEGSSGAGVPNPGQGGGSSTAAVEIYSRLAQGPWRLHLSAKAAAMEAGEEGPRRVLEELQIRCSTRVELQDQQNRLLQLGYQYGDRFQGLVDLWSGAAEAPVREALGRIEIPAVVEQERDFFSLHPGVLDVGWQAAAGLLPRDEAAGGREFPWLPTGCAGFSLGVSFSRSSVSGSGEEEEPESPTSLWVHIREGVAATEPSGDGASMGEALTVDVTLFEEDGEIVAHTRGLEVRRASSAFSPSASASGVSASGVSASAQQEEGSRGLPQKPEDWLYEPHWRPVPSSASNAKGSKASASGAAPAGTEPGCWLIFADRQGVGTALANRLGQRGDQVVVLQAGSSARGERPQASKSQWVDVGDPVAVREGLHRAVAAATAPIQGIVYLWALDAGEPDAGEPDAGESKAAKLDSGGNSPSSDLLWQSRILTSTVPLQLFQELALGGGQSPPRLWLASRGAVAVDDADDPVVLAQAPLWGLARVAAHEQPELLGAIVDLDGGALPEDASASLLAALQLPSAESQMAWRWGSVYVPRLVRSAAPAPGSPLQVRSEGTYWITGGTNGLGLEVARRLVERGARWLVLLSRRGLVEAAALEAVSAWRATGARVEAVALDVADSDALEALAARLAQQDWPQTAGVVHAAGVVEDGALAELTPESLDAVLRPKVLGAWALHQAFGQQPLDFFVLFSSAASLLGNPGQANYSAANAFLDALASHRSALGLPGVSIAWGLWSEVGFAARKAEAAEHLADLGFGTLEPASALDLFESLAAASPSQVLVLPASWSRLRDSATELGRSPLLADLFAEAREGQEASGGSVEAGALGKAATAAQIVGSVSDEERQRTLRGYLRQGLGDVLKIPPGRLSEDVPLTGLGLDSLVAVEWRNRLQTDLEIEVPLARLLGGVTLKDVAQQLAGKLAGRQSVAPPQPSSESSSAALAGAVRSQEEVADGGASEQSQENAAQVFPRGSSKPGAPAPAASPAISAAEALALLDRVDELSIGEAEGLLQRLEGTVAS